MYDTGTGRAQFMYECATIVSTSLKCTLIALRLVCFNGAALSSRLPGNLPGRIYLARVYRNTCLPQSKNTLATQRLRRYILLWRAASRQGGKSECCCCISISSQYYCNKVSSTVSEVVYLSDPAYHSVFAPLSFLTALARSC